MEFLTFKLLNIKTDVQQKYISYGELCELLIINFELHGPTHVLRDAQVGRKGKTGWNIKIAITFKSG